MVRLLLLCLTASSISCFAAAPALAHFLLLVPQPAERPETVEVYFGEVAAPEHRSAAGFAARPVQRRNA